MSSCRLSPHMFLARVVCVASIWGTAVSAKKGKSSASPSSSSSGDVFLGAEMPLKVLSVLPSSWEEGETAEISGRTALTMVFSRAVLALGADWSNNGNNGDLSQELTPFSFESCDGKPAFAVPGKIRWATTAIARFDADVDWPTDLCFDLVLNPDLRSFDGLSLAMLGSSRWRFQTPQMTMQISSVRSKRAANLTGGRWASEMLTSNHNDDAHECPDDAVVYLSFSSQIDHAIAFNSLRLANVDLLSSEESNEYGSCGPRCLAVRPRGLRAGERYELTFPQGGSYSQLAGTAERRTSVTLTGLLPFTFPFWFEKPPKKSWENRELRYRRHRLYLRHGLTDAVSTGDTIAALKAAMTLTNPSSSLPLQFNLTLLDAATLQLESSELQPGTRYSLQVRATNDVRDGFGQGLQSCGMEYDTQDWPDNFLEAGSGSLVHFREFSGDWKVLARGDDNKQSKVPYDLRAWPVPSSNIRLALAYRYNRYDDKMFGAPHSSVVAPLTNQLQVLGLDSAGLLTTPGGGLFLRERRQGNDRWSYRQKGFVSVAPFGVALVASASNELLVWATYYDTGEPVNMAAVTVYRVYNNEPKEEDVQIVASGATDANGTATLIPSDGNWKPEDSWYYQLVAVVESTNGEIALSEEVPTPWLDSHEEVYQAELITDRYVYRPGDTVYVKGYVRVVDGSELKLPSEDHTFYVEVTWKRESADVRIVANAVVQFGTVSANLTVPGNEADVDFGEVSVRLSSERAPDPLSGSRDISSRRRSRSNVNSRITTASILVADPRPPTVDLTLSPLGMKPALILPGNSATLDVGVRAATYSGTGVGGAEVTLSWTLSRATSRGRGDRNMVTSINMLPSVQPDPTIPKGGDSNQVVTGQMVVYTDDDGVANVTMDLAVLLENASEDGGAVEPCAEGDTLTVSARWVGPTREVVTAELEGGEVRIARSPYVLAVTPTRPVDLRSGRPLPGTPFSVYVDMRDATGKSVDGTSVNLSLHEWDGKTPVRQNIVSQPTSINDASPLRTQGMQSGLLPPSSWGEQVGDLCIATADGGTAAQCDSLTLPAAKKYVVLARARDPSGIELVAGFEVGKTPEEWLDNPLNSLESTITLRPDKEVYAVGDTASFTLVSPFEGATALVVWGNHPQRQSMQQKLFGGPGEEHTITIQVGEECRLGCYTLFVLSAPTQTMSSILPVEVPVSPLLDITLPRAAVGRARLNLPDTDRVFKNDLVEVAVVTESEQVQDVFEPGSKAILQVAAQAGAEVCVFVVDKAMLDVAAAVNPHDAVELDKRFALTRGQDFSVDDTRDGLASFGGYEATAAAVERRAGIDPWAYEWNWPLQSNAYYLAPVEQSDEAYFAEKTDDATRFPSVSWWRGSPRPVSQGCGRRFYYYNYYYFASEAWYADGKTEMSSKRSKGGGLAVSADMEMGMAPPAAPRPAPSPGRRRAAFSDSGADVDDSLASASGSRGGGGGAPAKSMLFRSKFETTPLFAASVEVGADGIAKIPLTLPDNIATFDVRAYVVDGNAEHQFGYATTEIVSRRSVSMVPSLPRVVRPGDLFECGISITGHGPTGLPAGGVDVMVQIQKTTTSLALREDDLANYSASGLSTGASLLLDAAGSGPHEILFPFEVPPPSLGGGVGLATMSFAVTTRGAQDASAVQDALETKLKVAPQQAPVSVATSFVITPSSKKMTQWAEGVELPDAMPGSGQLQVMTGVGHLPSIVVNIAHISSRELNNGEVLVAALFPAACYRLYYALDAATAELDLAAELFSNALGALPSYTSQSSWPPLGLTWRMEETKIRGYTPRASIQLNSFALLTHRIVQVFQERGPMGAHESRGSWASLDLSIPYDLTQEWQTAIEQELYLQVEDARKYNPDCRSDCYKSWETLAQAWAALGSKWMPSRERTELALDRFFDDKVINKLRPDAMANVALAYTLHSSYDQISKRDRDKLDGIYRRLAVLIRVQGRTAYIAASPDSAHSADISSNALILLAIARASSSVRQEYFGGSSGSSLVAKLAAYVAGGGHTAGSQRFGGGYWMSARGAAWVSAALAAYDLAYDSTQPDLFLNATSGNVPVISYEASGGGAPPAPAKVAMDWEMLESPPPPLRFEALGNGQVSVVAALTFVPSSMPLAGSIYRGLFVERVVQEMDPASGKAVGPALHFVRLGASVVVTIQITTPDDVSRVTVEDLSAGGLEPVDPKVSGDESGSSVSGCDDGGGCFRWSWWCVPAFPYRETYADRVTWTSWSTLHAGTHTVTYQAVAATRGVFSLPPVHAYVDEQPELMGLSQAGYITVVDESRGITKVPDPRNADEVAVALRALNLSVPIRAAPKSCPDGCPNGGTCNVETGTCMCYEGVRLVDGDCSSTAGQQTIMVDFTSDTKVPLVPGKRKRKAAPQRKRKAKAKPPTQRKRRAGKKATKKRKASR